MVNKNVTFLIKRKVEDIYNNIAKDVLVKAKCYFDQNGLLISPSKTQSLSLEVDKT